ncbi:MAG: hypothetical protein LBD77_05055 [Bifidobacteriaceae bacterium]|jgi:hypothetical protein|nr:hypothetical protein [Bifidobacteriaceae bacterium]
MKTSALRFLAIAAVAAATVLGGAAPNANAAASATAGTPDSEIIHALAAQPGGHATGAHSAYWPALGMSMESSQAPSAQVARGVVLGAVGNCASGSVCAYSGYMQTGAKLSWTTCGTHSTGTLGAVRSIANARSSGTLKAKNGSTIVATAAAGAWATVSGTVTNVSC